MDKHAIKEKGKQLIDHLPGWGDIHGAFTLAGPAGKRHQLSVGPKLVTLAALSTAFCAVALCRLCRPAFPGLGRTGRTPALPGRLRGLYGTPGQALWITMKNFSGNFPKWLNWKRLSERKLESRRREDWRKNRWTKSPRNWTREAKAAPQRTISSRSLKYRTKSTGNALPTKRKPHQYASCPFKYG